MRIVSLNIEQNHHLDRVVNFVQQSQPDIVMFQEVFELDLPYLQTALQMEGTFCPLSCLDSDAQVRTLGLATLSKWPLTKSQSLFYRGSADRLPTMTIKQPEKMARALLITEVANEKSSICLANTHFTWSPNATPNTNQHHDLEILLNHMSQYSECILAGDFNSPRGKVIFDTLSHHYQDNIPSNITSTIDGNLHVAGHLDIVVDGFFTTPYYQVNKIKVVNGISDHCAILAEVTLTQKANKHD